LENSDYNKVSFVDLEFSSIHRRGYDIANYHFFGYFNLSNFVKPGDNIFKSYTSHIQKDGSDIKEMSEIYLNYYFDKYYKGDLSKAAFMAQEMPILED
jgi:hypothetical protein